MAGKLVQVATNTVTSAVASVTLTGIDSDDVYMVAFNKILTTNDTTNMRLRVTTSGTGDSTSNYDRASKILNTSSFANSSGTNQTSWSISATGNGTSGQETTQGIFYLFNFNNSSEYSFYTLETVRLDSTPILAGNMGGGVHTVAQSCDGVEFIEGGGSTFTGIFTLYRVV